MSLRIPGAEQFHHARVAVVGMGISGVASVEALVRHTLAKIGVWDAREVALAPYRENSRVERAFSTPDPEALAYDVLAWKPTHVIIAPAIAEQSVQWKILHSGGVPVWSEIELAWQLRAMRPDGTYAPWLGVTGTNGKTTTTTMLAAILRKAGLGGQAVGNVGNPAVTAVSDTSPQAPRAYALELSSFQLASTYSMQLKAALCLNIADDHLEWHQDFSSYRAAKASIYEGVATACVYPVGDSDVQAMVDQADVQEGARAIGVSLGIPAVGQIGIAEGFILDRAFGARRYHEAIPLVSLDALAHLAPYGSALPVHIVKDALGACALARSIGVDPSDIQAALAAFPAGKHRIEHVASVDDISFIDDSKATNAHAALASLSAQKDGTVVWIAGGLPKGAHFVDLVQRIKAKLKAVVVIGVDQQPWHEALDATDLSAVYVNPDAPNPMDTAVRMAYQLADPADTVLLAPACASMDQFASYADRGDAFARAVLRLGKVEGSHEASQCASHSADQEATHDASDEATQKASHDASHESAQ